MAVVCDSCGTKDNVKRQTLTVWNGNIFDLCRPCFKPIASALDSVSDVWLDNEK